MTRAHVADKVRILETEIHGNVNLSTSTISSIEIGPATTAKGIHMGAVNAGDLLIYNSKTGNLRIYNSHIVGDMSIKSCVIRENVEILRTQIGGDFDFTKSRISGEGEFGDGGESLGATISAWGTKMEGDFVLSASSGWDFLSASGAKVGGNVKLNGVSTWRVLNFDNANVGGTLDLSDSIGSTDGQFLNLRNAEVTAIELRDSKDRIENKKLKCGRENFAIDFFGWRYDARKMEYFLKQDAKCLDKWIAEFFSSQTPDLEALNEPRQHVPQPYLYMAERLEELGMTDKANKLRILEKERDLAERTRLDGGWQWLVGRTTGFGYSPGWALVWFFALIVVGTIFVFLANWDWASQRIKENRMRKGMYWAVALLLVFIYYFCFMKWVPWKDTWNGVGFSAIGAAIWLFGALILYGSGVALKNANKAAKMDWKWFRSTFRSGGLYSLDRALPFLGFDGEHVSWFEKESRLNENGTLCVYFYFHSVLGFALITLFIAGLTGVLK